MQVRWQVLRAAQDCRFKAWRLAEKESADIGCWVDEGRLHLELPVERVSVQDRIAAMAWYYQGKEVGGGSAPSVWSNIEKLVIQGREELVRASVAKPMTKAVSLLKDMKSLLGAGQAPPFYRNRHCPECPWREDCMARLKERDCISLLGGMTPKVLEKYHKKGVFSILQLSYLFRPRRRGRKLLVTGRFPWELKALAIREQRTYVLHRPSFPETEVSIYLDMEGLPDEGYIYLVGGLVVGKDGQKEAFAFWADGRKGEGPIFGELGGLLGRYPEAMIYHYGSYEVKAIKRYPALKGIEKRMVNLLGLLRTHVFPPTYGNGLKELGRYIGFTWSDPEAGGLASIRWRKEWEQVSGDRAKGMKTVDGDKEGAAEEWKQRLILYNSEDCAALRKVREWMEGLVETEIKKYSPYKFDMNPEFGEDFHVISKAAYFDYQRSRIYWRNAKKGSEKRPVLRKDTENRKGHGVVVWQPKKANEVVTVPPLTQCPYCGHRKVYHLARWRTFKQTDLKFTKGGIRQWVREFQSGSGKCARCGAKYNDSLVRMVHFGDNLFAWAVNLYVNYNISHEMVSRLLEEQFGIWANRLYFMQRKEKWFQRFLPDVERIKSAVLQSPVIHIDETQIKLSRDSGYVWVLATTDSVFYHLTLTREAEFLGGWLKDYRGVVVTDFFPGYERLNLTRQKCLIHLIRDLNDDLFKNPFDAEYKTMVVAFGKLLRGIVATVDRFGLKKRNLHKHENDVEAFRRQFLEREQASELSRKYAKRLQKHWDECWTFLRHDGIPWNNNNAEAAIKGFALHRRGVSGKVTERRLREYLNMLSLAQTCRYRNVSFLDFLRGEAGKTQ